MKAIPLTKVAAAAAALMLGGLPMLAQAQAADAMGQPAPAAAADPTKEFVKKVNDATGLEFWGYARGGFYVGDKDQGRLRGNYSLGGDLQKYRLGNEGDQYIEFGLGKRFDLGGGLKWGVFYMPKVYNGDSGTAQVYTSMTGMFGNNVSVWAGQRYHRIQDVHIVDKWVMEDGDNFGAGFDDIPVGLGTLNVAVYNSGSFDNKAGNPNDAKRLNLQWRKIPTNPGGMLTLTGAMVSGKFTQGKDGGALGLLHNQKDFLVTGLNNSLFLQTSTGHASVNGKFFGLDTAAGVPQMGAKQNRILDSVDFQIGKLGGQAMVGYQTLKPDTGDKIKDFSLGGRLSYGIAPRTKLLTEVATTSRKIDGQDSQRLNKGTVAVAFSPNTDFWTRPEFRIYATRANWNTAAEMANANSYGFGNRKSSTTFGAQMEVWWE